MNNDHNVIDEIALLLANAGINGQSSNGFVPIIDDSNLCNSNLPKKRKNEDDGIDTRPSKFFKSLNCSRLPSHTTKKSSAI